MAKNIAKVTPSLPAKTFAELYGHLVERVEPKAFIGGSEPDPESFAAMLRDELDPATAWAALLGTFGMGRRYANKEQLSSTGQTFSITRIVERINGGYEKEDDWAYELAVEDGSIQVLTMEKNPQRDTFTYMLAAGLDRYGKTTALQLERIELKETDKRPPGRSFYTLVPAFMEVKAQPKPVGPITYEAK